MGTPPLFSRVWFSVDRFLCQCLEVTGRWNTKENQIKNKESVRGRTKEATRKITNTSAHGCEKHTKRAKHGCTLPFSADESLECSMMYRRLPVPWLLYIQTCSCNIAHATLLMQHCSCNMTPDVLHFKFLLCLCFENVSSQTRIFLPTV